MDDLYDEVGVEDKLSVSYYMQDEIRLALRDLQTPSARIAQRRLKFLQLPSGSIWLFWSKDTTVVNGEQVGVDEIGLFLY